MTYSYIARQPILNRDKQTVGYELLFRDGPQNTFPEIDPEHATSRLLSDHFLSTHYETLGDKLGFVNFPYQSLLNKVPTLFPADNLVVEILEDCPPTKELLDVVKEMAAAGYKIALDDFIPSKEWRAFLPYISIIKFDIRLVPIEKARNFILRLAGTNIKFLAEKVETYEEFEQSKQAGFEYFQGYFFSKPEMITRKSLEPSFMTVIQLLTEISKQDMDYESIESLISKDVTLSYKLLTFVNSSSIVQTKIQSFKQALVYLGEDKLRKFISLVSLASSQESKPDYLYGLSIQRARYCELLASRLDAKFESGQAFLTGMFSLLDSLLDRPLEQIVEEISVDESIKLAITKNEGILGEILMLTKAYEQAQWEEVRRHCDSIGVDEIVLSECYDSSVKWTADLLSVKTN
ncbi:HDOD domain-containing protein [Vibrio tubiashii]|uniref:Histidine kinase n=1 Tax=Vibrio tubiashii ATCC 19109 TaxID=1051646 RepID=F9T2L7_9VIBR|nr:EAL and HDOD domain-containing protein [Vibrio tubiashii]AIW13601.1 histidine kinase [Vibrio tubiashii ATCC 19109]EGU57682.1 signal transduction protein [Vibrio tubiashii ATCC 19109]EIF01906.1 signal transduction protein [Vibrio tubiashii NCIMB 1337 = ATCC 19106]WCP68048.1 HDOD domain-containing protein [Vibrio tubiashii]